MQYTLKNSSGLQAVVESHGGELVSFKDKAGTEFIWSGDAAYWAGQNPLLFPIVGTLKEGKILIGGKTFEMARHGVARHGEYTPVAQTEDSITLELTESEDTLAQYPFPFRVLVGQKLEENGFTTTLTVQNIGSSPMPFCIGAHPAFRCPIYPGERFEDYNIVFDKPETLPTQLLTPAGVIRDGETEPCLENQRAYPLRHEVFERLDTVILEGLASTGAALVHKDTGKGLHMAFRGFPVFALWTMGAKKAPYICLEPWHGCAAHSGETGRFEDKPHCVTLQPGEEKQLSYTVSLV